MTAITTWHSVTWALQCLMYIPDVRCQRVNWKFDCTLVTCCLRKNNIYSYFTWQVKAIQITDMCISTGFLWSVGSVLYVQIVLQSLSGHFGGGQGSLLPGIELQFSGYSAGSLVTVLTTLYQLFNISMDLIVITYRISRTIRCTFFPEKCDLNSTCVLYAESKYRISRTIRRAFSRKMWPKFYLRLIRRG